MAPVLIANGTADTGSAPWSASLLSVRARCLSWVEQSLPRFDPRSAVPGDPFLARKAFAELCLAACLIAHFEHPFAVPEPIAALIRDVCSDPAFRDRGCADPFGVLAYVYPALADNLLHADAQGSEADAGNPLFRHVRHVLSAPLLLSQERAPHRIADILFGRWLFTRRQADRDALRRVWCVSNGAYLPHAAVNSLEDFYAYTHNVFYAAGFGLFAREDFDREDSFSHPAPAGLDAEAQEFAMWRFAAESNWDVALELAIAQLLLDRPATSGTVAVLARLFDDAETLGYLAGPPPRRSRRRPPEPAWTQHYHTTLVGILFCTLAVQPEFEPFLASIAHVGERSSLGALLAAGSILSDVQHRRNTGKRELAARKKALEACPDLAQRLERFLERVPAEFRTWTR